MTDLQIQFENIEISPESGLNEEQVRLQRSQFGSNLLSPPPRTPWWRQLLDKLKDPTIIILLASAVISLTMTAIEKYALSNPEVHFTESIGIFLAVFLAIAVGYLSERKSEGEFEALNKVKDDIPVKAIRNGQITTIPIGEVVAGDCIRLDLGDKVPADGVMLDGMGLLIDESLLTGESVPVKKTPAADKAFTAESPKQVNESSRLYRSTMVNDGHGILLATQVGDSTQVGQIAAHLIEDESKSVTPLVQKLSRLAKQISILGVSGALAIFTCMSVETIIKSPLLTEFTKTPYEPVLAILSLIVGVLMMRFMLRPFFSSMDMALRGWIMQAVASVPMIVMAFAVGMSLWGFYGVFDDAAMNLLQQVLTAFVVAVTIIVVAVPEGLPMMVTVSLAMNMLKMARQNCLVRKLVASETIGCATVICSDKTGTLTQNKMQPVWFWANGKQYNQADFAELIQTSAWKEFVESVCLNSEGNLEISTDGAGRKTVHRIGNPTECALLALFEENGVDYLQQRAAARRVFEMNHNSQRKMSMALVESPDEAGLYICHVKGAPERILSKCAFVQLENDSVSIDSYLEQINSALAAASDRALRILAVAQKTSCKGCFNPEQMDSCLGCPSYKLIALVGIEDPVRDEVPLAVERCQAAGVKVKMITGDAKPTAVAIAKGCGILSKGYTDNSTGEELVLTSDELAQVSDSDLPGVAQRLKVLARSTPMDKLRLVKAMHHDGETVAMTGDGTNDAPALKFADVGLSMGISGTEVAKEASDIVLVDDNFKSIVTGIWWGRTLYQNIQRFLQFQLSVNFVALSCALIGPLVGIALPLTVTQLLWINIIMDTFAAIAYSTDPPREFSMRRKPVSRQAHIIMPSMWFSILLNSAFQVSLLFAVLYFGWFLEPGEQKFQWGCDMTDAGVIKANLPALTVFFTTFVMFQFWHKFNCRALFHNESPFTLIHKNRLFLIIIALITLSQVIMVQYSGYFHIGQIFRTCPLSLRQWGEITLFTAMVVPFAWVVHQLAFLSGAEK